MGPLEAELAGLPELTIHHLRILWRRVHGGAIEPPAPFTRDLLARAIAYRMQEQVHGGLAPAARRRLRPSPGFSIAATATRSIPACRSGPAPASSATGVARPIRCW